MPQELQKDRGTHLLIPRSDNPRMVLKGNQAKGYILHLRLGVALHLGVYEKVDPRTPLVVLTGRQYRHTLYEDHQP